MSGLISIIIPIYNAEKWIERCINSILNQNYTKIELILVNDGSTDSSGRICDSYEKKDNRIKVIHKKNEGVSIARNNGKSIASGEYLYFMDADDMLKKNTFEKLINVFNDNKVNIILFGYENLSNNEEVIPIFEEGVTDDFSSKLKNYKHINSKNQFCFSWRFIFKRTLIEDINNNFNSDIKIGEDTLFNMTAVFSCNQIYTLKESLYIYNDLNSESAMRKKYKVNFTEDINNNYKEKVKLFKKYKIKDINFIDDLYYYNICGLMITCIKNIYSGEKNICKSELRKLLNSEICIESFEYFNLKELRQIANNKIFYMFLCICKLRLTFIVHLYCNYFYS